MGTRVSSTQIIGRDAELDTLRRALAAAADGRPSMVLVGGDSGAGKTRLLSALREHAGEQGARVLVGECLELGDAELPYAPLVAALRPLVRDHDPVLDRLLPAQHAELARLLPGLATEVPRRPAAADGSAQGRLFEALLALVDELARDAPVVLALEDLHWADPSSRAFLAFLARGLTDERVLVAGTFRSDELHRRHPLRPLLADLDRDPRVRRIDLAPLDRGQVAEVLADITGHAPSPALVDRLYARSEGNPLYLEELVAAGSDGRGALPSSLREALMLRIERLADPAQELLRLLAVGHRLDHAMLADASGLDAAVLRGAVREAVAAHLVTADEQGRHVFRHALLREVVADDLLPGERTELHLALARALERRHAAGEASPQLASLISHHFYEAGDRPAAFSSALRAADAAECARAYAEAATLLERALALWEQVPAQHDLVDGGHVALLSRAAEAHYAAGDPLRQEALLRAALDEVDEAAEPTVAAALLEQFARGQRTLNRTREALDHARRGLALVDGTETCERARLLAFIAKTRVLQGKWRDAEVTARAAIEAARTAGDVGSEITAMDAMGLSLSAAGDLERGPAHLRRAIVLALEHEDADAASIAYLNLADVLHLRGNPDEARAVVAEGLEITPPGRCHRWMSVLMAEFALDRGDWDAVEELLGPRSRRLVGNDLLNVGLRRAELALGCGDHERARDDLDGMQAAAGEVAEPQYLGAYGALRAELRRREGDLDGARDAIDDALDRIEFCTEDVMRLSRIASVGLVVEADRAERARDLSDAAEEERALACTASLLARLEAIAAEGGPVERAWAAAGAAHAGRAQGHNDPATWASAASSWDLVGRPYLAACARWRQAEALLAADDRAAASAPASEALQAARRIGAGWLAGELTALAARGRLRLAPDASDRVAGRASAVPEPVAEDPFGLTERERQVLARVAQGRTNRQIGAELFMAEKTASVHVSRILAKLDVRSRTQAAALAHRLGLAGPPA